MDTREFNEIIAANSSWISALRTEVGKVVIGQQALVDRLILSLLCKGHVLLEGVPGLAKTLSVKAMAGTLHAQFARIQFTPDLLPADLLGTMIYNPEERQFTAKKGPIFANLILADEINRAPAKVQSALLEAMQERQVTLGETTYRLPDPFLVLATQNPIDQEGTYQLPEAQLDRFLFKVLVTYPTREEELQVLDLMASSAKPPETSPVTTPEQVAASRDLVNQIYIDDAVRGYIVDLVRATRFPETVDARGHLPALPSTWLWRPAPMPSCTIVPSSLHRTSRTWPTISCATASCSLMRLKRKTFPRTTSSTTS